MAGKTRTVLVTGGAGFIGSAFVRLTRRLWPDARVVNLDALTYAGNLDNLSDVPADDRYRFVHGDICDAAVVQDLFATERPTLVVHFAAESHVDRSIHNPGAAVDTNVVGTSVLLQAARQHGLDRFIHVSTDEVYGSIAPPHEADEQYPLNPSSAYSASKAGADLLALAYFKTYKLPVIVTRASNNYGPYQFPEKLIPLMISNALEQKPLPVYGDGSQVRDWLYVDDHCRAIHAVVERGRTGEVYNIGGTCALRNLEVVERILAATGRPASLIQRVADRPAHDVRYALTSHKIQRDTGWAPEMPFDRGLAETIAWYQGNVPWLDRVRSGDYRAFYAVNYDRRQ